MNRQVGAEIEVTPEMVRAGVLEYEYVKDSYPDELVVERVCIAMLARARKR